jgi:hypothetical protein
MGKTNTTGSDHSRRNRHRMQGKLLDRSLCDDHILVLCI